MGDELTNLALITVTIVVLLLAIIEARFRYHDSTTSRRRRNINDGSSASGREDRELITVGTWGRPNEGDPFDHQEGLYGRIKTIKIHCGWVVDSIQVQYIRENGDQVWTPRVGGEGGNPDEFVLEDGEYINEITGYYGRLFGMGTVNSLTFFTNKNNKFGPYGLNSGTTLEEKEAEPTRFHVKGGKIVGFHGTAERFLSSIGFYISSV